MNIKFLIIIVFLFFTQHLYAQEKTFPYQNRIENLLYLKKTQVVLDFVNPKLLKNNVSVDEILILKSYKVEALMQAELYSEAIQLSNSVINSPEVPQEFLLRNYILRELAYEILENFTLAEKEIVKAEYLLHKNPDLKAKYYTDFLVRKSSIMRLLGNENFYKVADQAISYGIQVGDDKHIISAYFLKGIFYTKSNPKKALELYQTAQKLCEKTGDIDGYILLGINIFKLYMLQNDFENAKRNLDKSFANLSKTDRIYTKFWVYKNKADYFETIGKYDSAYVNFKKFKKYNDQYDFSQKKTKLKELAYIAQNQKEKEIRKNAQEKTEKVIGILILSLFLLLILLLLLNKINRNNKKIKKQNLTIQNASVKLEKLLDNRTFLLKELNHRIQNNFATILGIIYMQKGETTDKKNNKQLEDLQGRIHTISLAQKLYTYDFESNETDVIELRSYFTEIIDSTKNSQSQIAECVLDAEDDFTLNVSKALPLGLILNELLTNSFKHSLPKENFLKISVALKKIDSKIYFFYADNGTIFERKERKGSFGRSVIEGMVRQLDGKLTQKDFHYTIIF